MKCRKTILVILTVFALPFFPSQGISKDLSLGEKNVIEELQSMIPNDKRKTIDDLYAKWIQIQHGVSDAIIIDIRTEAEFDAGHITGSSNIDSGHAYGIPKKINNPVQEIWVLCRTQHRATYFVGMLYKYGYANVFLVEGGIKSWSEKGYPLANKYLGEIIVAKYYQKFEENYWYRENK